MSVPGLLTVILTRTSFTPSLEMWLLDSTLLTVPPTSLIADGMETDAYCPALIEPLYAALK